MTNFSDHHITGQWDIEAYVTSYPEIYDDFFYVPKNNNSTFRMKFEGISALSAETAIRDLKNRQLTHGTYLEVISVRPHPLKTSTEDELKAKVKNIAAGRQKKLAE